VNTLIVVAISVAGAVAETLSTVQIGEVGGSVSVGEARTNLYERAFRKIVARPEESRMIGLLLGIKIAASA
jgi:hypothetical protein